MSESTTAHHEGQAAPGKTGKKDFLSGNGKWYLIGGLGVIAVLVFLFVKQSNANSSSGTSATGTTLDPTTEAMLQSALQSQASQGYGSAAYVVPPSSNTGVTTTSSTPSSGVPFTVNLPNGQLGWEQITFPSVSAYNTFESDIGGTPTQPWGSGAPRSLWNSSLTAVGATGMIPEATYNPNAPLGSPQNTGLLLDTE